MNADGKEIYLVTVTHHSGKPSLLREFEDLPVYWTNWISLSKRVNRIGQDEVPVEQRVPLRMLKDLFEVEEMEPFRGFDRRDKEQYRYFIRDVRPELNKLGLENRGKMHDWTRQKANPSGWRRIVPKYLSIPFVHQDRPPHDENGRPKSKRASVFSVIVDTEEHNVYAGVTFGSQKVPAHRKMLLKHGDEIADECQSQGFEMWIGRNSINNRSVRPERTEDVEEMKDWLSESGKKALAHPDEDNHYRKVRFLRKCTQSDPQKLFESVEDAIEDQIERFLQRDDFVDLPTLVDPDSVVDD